MYGQGPGMGGGAQGQAIFTDDVSLQVFMEHLKRLVSLIAKNVNKIFNGFVGRGRSNYLECMQRSGRTQVYYSPVHMIGYEI